MKSTLYSIKEGKWLRDQLVCIRCYSIPRWRALVYVLEEHFPNWRELRVHESSPGGAASAKLAREYGIYRFCYYHYWFNSRRILEHPFNEVLTSGKPDFPFCLCWANENWTRVWDGGNKHILLEQKYNHDDDRAHIESIIPAFIDNRYIYFSVIP